MQNESTHTHPIPNHTHTINKHTITIQKINNELWKIVLNTIALRDYFASQRVTIMGTM